MEIKQAGPFPGAFDIVDVDQGIAKEIIAVFGIVDEGLDRVWPGAFTKTINEGVGRFRVVDSHNHQTVQAVLGVNLGMEEIPREALPAETQAKYPDATGGVLATTRYLLDTPEGFGAFVRRREGALPQSSYGYDALDTDSSSEQGPDGQAIKVRNIRTLKLYEYGPCVFGMNPATSVVGVKTSVAMEGKPWGIFVRDDEYCVYRVNADGEAEGESRGCHATLEEAEAQVAALYANADEEAALTTDDVPAEEEFITILWAKAAAKAGPEAGAEEVLNIALDWVAQLWADKQKDIKTELTPELMDKFAAWIQTARGEGKADRIDDSEAGPDGATPPAADGGPGPDTEAPPTSPSDEAAILSAKIKVALARLELDSML